MEEGFPELTDSFLAGQDILYKQFNDIEFYVEDFEQEHFYFNILKNLFPDIKFEKIFPLNGKRNVVDSSKLSIDCKTKIYIVDLDFDEILGIKETNDNLFYLEKYCIENHLISKNGIFELIREKNAKLKNEEIEILFNFDTLLLEIKEHLEKLACCFLINRKHSLGIKNLCIEPSREFDLTQAIPTFRNNLIIDYYNHISQQIILFNESYSLDTEIQKIVHFFNTVENALKNIPGKFLLNMIKCKLEKLKLIYQVTLESFTYKLSKELNINELQYLKIEISNYID
ncbi:MAG: DUF4435 domain-containing protein [Flavobacteriaceae bacterium]|nr:DUF4435 domain-containing protein [Flavobacteriaceae bacterium]